jgi:CDP-paratose 2-epimerase
MKYLVTGGCGFIGSNLAAEVLKRGEELVVFDNLFRHGSSSNLEWLKSKGNFKYYPYDIRNINDVETVIQVEKPDVVFHLAGQVAMTTSISNPRLDFEVNALGTFNLLDSIRKFAPNAMILYSSSNKVYGDFKELTFVEKKTRYDCLEHPTGFDENLSLNFHSPYGCSKGTADQYLIDFNRIYGLKTVVFRHSSMYGGNQHSTIDQGWIGWFCQKAIDIKNGENVGRFTISGSGKQVRDVLHAKDVVSLYFSSVEHIENVKGKCFNIGGGIEYSLSLLELFKLLEKKLNIEMDFTRLPQRESDQLFFVANNKKISNLTGWVPKINTDKGLDSMLNWLQKNR